MSLSRAEKRAVGNLINRKSAKTNLSPESIIPVSGLLDKEDDIKLYTQQLALYKGAQQLTETKIRFLSLLGNDNMPAEMIIPALDGKALNPEMAIALSEYIDVVKVLRARKLIANLQGIIKTLKSKYFDEEEQAVIRGLAEIPDITIGEALKDVYRARRESIELIGMQINWLKNEDPRNPNSPEILSVDHPPPPVSNEDQTMESVPVYPAKPSDPTRLQDWSVFWTNQPWSTNPSHLVQIPTDSRELAIKTLGDIGRGEISIRPGSVLRALEFYLKDKDTVQRLAGTRLRYLPLEVRDWARIKRGRDRIPLLVDNASQLVVFFVAGRDEVYRALSRM